MWLLLSIYLLWDNQAQYVSQTNTDSTISFKQDSKITCNDEGIKSLDTRLKEALDKEDYALSFKLATNLCNCGNKNCNSLGWHYYNGKGVARDFVKARELFENACDSRDYRACNNLGDIYHYGKDVVTDYKIAFQLYGRSCHAEVGLACGNLAYSFYTGRGVAQDYQNAFKFATKGYNLGDVSISGGILSSAYAIGNGVKEDYHKAFEYAKKSCDAGGNLGCATLSLLYQSGNGVKQNCNKAIKFAKKSCDLGNAIGCLFHRDWKSNNCLD